MTAVRLLAPWIDNLSLQQQAVVVLACRGPDGFPKYHPCKQILYYYRGSVMAAAHVGRLLEVGENVSSLMTLDGFDNETRWEMALSAFSGVEDELPLHYYTHLMHGAQVVGYKHSDHMFRARWHEFYFRCTDYLHVPVETEQAMDKRLNDFGRPLDKVVKEKVIIK